MKRILILSINLITLLLFSAIGIHASAASNFMDAPGENMKSYTEWAITNSGGDIHSGPNLDSPIILKAPDQSIFPLIDRSGKWIEIQLGSTQTGWIEEESVETKNTDVQYQTVTLQKNAMMYDGPDETFRATGTAPSPIPYLPQTIGGQWIQVLSMKTGQMSWVSVNSVMWGGTAKNLLPSAPAIPASAEQTNDLLQGKTIVVDPGHGGKDTGAIGIVKPVYERDVNMTVALVLANKLKAAGAHVILTRHSNEEYVSLAERVKLTNENKADLFISIHQNQYPKDPSVNGTITYYYNTAKSKSLAQVIEKQAISSLNGSESQNEITQDKLYVISQNTRPSVLVEGCFLSNEDDLNNSILPDYQEQLSSGIYHGILEYFGMYSADSKSNYL